MINLLNMLEFSQVAFVGILFAFAFTCMAIAKFNPYLPKDMGRQFAHDGKLSAGKPRGDSQSLGLERIFQRAGR